MSAGPRLFSSECRFVAGAAGVASLPPLRAPEVAFAGRSNVGKSSLINALTKRHALARVSRTPGATQQINFYAIGDRLTLADLPGYGFARASKRKVGAWSDLIRLYLTGRPNLRRVLTLIDARRGLLDLDRELFDFLDSAGLSYQIVLTKADEIPPAALAALIAETSGELAKRPAAHPRVIATSAHSGAGIDDLRAEVAALAT